LRRDDVGISASFHRHCEERSDEAISVGGVIVGLPRPSAEGLAMTDEHVATSPRSTSLDVKPCPVAFLHRLPYAARLDTVAYRKYPCHLILQSS
jgi:hypothetical protein